MKIKIFVIEDHPVFITGLRNSFRESRDNVSIAGSGNTLPEGVKLAAQTDFDIFLLDLYLPDSDPLENVRILKKVFPDKPIVILTSETRAIWKYWMAEAGVLGYIQKGVSRSTILEILRKAVKGISSIDSADYMPKTGEPPFLTPDQQEIMLLLSKGMTLKDISGNSQMSVSMIEKNLRILRKNFNMQTNAGLVKELSNRGFI